MSDYLKKNIDYLDDNTHLIIDGYFHIECPLYIIPSDIIYLTTLFVDDHFMISRGGHQWYIDSELLNKLKKANRKERFVSPTFKIAELDWMICVFPNGYTEDDPGNCMVFLALLSLPQKWSDLALYYDMSCAETMSSYGHQFRVSDYTYLSWGWPVNTMRLNEIESLDHISITISVIINEIRVKSISETDDKLYYRRNTCIPKDTTIEWNITPKTLSRMKSSHAGKRYISWIYNEAFQLELCPNGKDIDDEGWTHAAINLCGFPENVSKINLKWNIKLEARILPTDGKKEEVVSVNGGHTNDFEGGDSSSKHWGTEVLAFEEFKTFDVLKIIATIKNEDAYRLERESKTTLKWDKFMKQSNSEQKQVDKYEERLGSMEKKLELITTQIQQLTNMMIEIRNATSHDQRIKGPEGSGK